MMHKFKGKDSYILVQTTGLPTISDVYVVTINKKVKDKSSEEDSSEDDDDDGRLQAIRIRVYNRTVEFKKGRKITVSTFVAFTEYCSARFPGFHFHDIFLLTGRWFERSSSYLTLRRHKDLGAVFWSLSED